MLNGRIVQKTTTIGAGIVCGGLMLLATVGCKPKSGGNNTPSPSPSASASATPFPISIRITGSDSFLFDAKGQRVAEVKADEMVANPQKGSGPDAADGAIRQGSATLYQNGKPAATFRADVLKADREKRTVVGTGNVIVRALRPDSPAVRADTMTWFHDENKITGSGHVVVTREPDMRFVGDEFEADTAAQKFRIWSGAKDSGVTPATGSPGSHN